MNHEEMIKTEAGCHALLFEMKFPGGKFVCPRCKNTSAYDLSRRRLKECKKCRKQVSARTGTIFEKSKIKLTKAFRMINDYGKGAVKAAARLARELGLDDSTVWRWRHKLRIAMLRIHPETNTILADRELLEAVIFRRSVETPARNAEKPPAKVEEQSFAPRDINEEQAVSNVVDFIAKTYKGVAEKYIQLYGTEFRFLRDKRGHGLPELLSVFIRAGPVLTSEIDRFSSPKFIGLPDPKIAPFPELSNTAGL